jgi:uncharacterized membrane protein YbhN (UPF0104 family)
MAGQVEVVESPLPQRVRRPADAARLVVAVGLLVLIVFLADVAVGASGALESELFSASSGLPFVVLLIVGWVNAFGVILLPVAMGIDLVLHRQVRLVAEAIAAAALAGLLVLWVDTQLLGTDWNLVKILTRPAGNARTAPLDPTLVGLMAFLTVCRVNRRRWHQVAAITVIVASMIVFFLAGASTGVALIVSVLLGWATGLLVRLALGVAPAYASGSAVARALVGAGVPLRRLVRMDDNRLGDRTYAGWTRSALTLAAGVPSPQGEGGADLQVIVVDRDTFGVKTVRDVLRRMRLRSASTRKPALTVQGEIEYRSLMSLTYERLGIRAPRFVGAAAVGAFSSAIAVTPVHGRTLGSGVEVSEADLAGVWEVVRRMRHAKVTHRRLGPQMIVVDEPAGVVGLGSGDIAADDLTLRLDLAQALVTVGLAVGAERAVSSAVAALGPDSVRGTFAVLQKVALTAETRADLKHDRHLLGELRERVAALSPGAEPAEPIELRRLSPRTVLMMVAGTVAAYLLVGQLAQVNLASLVANANWWWAAACVGAAATTFVGPSLSIGGAVAVPLRFARTYLTQLAVAFSGIVAPAAVGNIALNTRYLVSAGLTPAVAAASIGLVQIMQLLSYVFLLLTAGVIAGTGTAPTFTPSPWLVAALPLALLLVLALLAVKPIRAFVAQRVLPQVRSVVPQVARVVRSPRKLGQMVGGSLLLDLSFVTALVCATRAFGADAPIAGVAVVYFAGAIIGSAVPTPGGLGGIEAAMSAGLVAIGVDGGIAVSSVLLYRLATYWLPIPFGWWALGHLQKKKVI